MKNDLRVKFKHLRNQLSNEQLEILSHKIFLKLKSILFKFKTDKFFVYNSFGSEVKTDEIFNFLISANKQVFLPRVEGENMVAVKLTKNTTFKKSNYGINEPFGNAEAIDDFVTIVPCLAVDDFGNRLGYGGGYYDRFLNGKNSIKIAICFDFQIAKNIETTPFDVSMDYAVSEKQIKNFKK